MLSQSLNHLLIPRDTHKQKSLNTMALSIISNLRTLRLITVILGLSNLSVVILGGFLIFLMLSECELEKIRIPIGVVCLASVLKIFALIQTGLAQKATALAMLDSSDDDNSVVADSVMRIQRKMRYKMWLRWTRFAMVITSVQVLGTVYLLYNVAKFISQDGLSDQCHLGTASNDNHRKEKLLILFSILGCAAPLVQCFAGSDVLRWRSFYDTKDDAWKSHYQEVFDYGIREALCCLGRVEYLTSSKEDEIYSVARLLGDLVAYRASGTGHLELLAGLALLERHRKAPEFHERLLLAPMEQIQEALALHEFAEAAYTGPLLDFGRHNVFFPCAWFYRQGILTPWTRNRRPLLAGDNWWSGHAAAFLNYINLPSEALRCGRVHQNKCEAAYFIVVQHHLRTVIIAIRGTETPQDLITDGLGRECSLSREDLDGLINSNNIACDIKQWVESSFPHFGYSGIVEAARDLYLQIDGNVCNKDIESESSDFLSSLLGAGCECDGYNLRIVGHSLGGAIAALLGIRLYHKYPNLHVYSYGPLPCVDSTIAEACQEFVTSIVHDNEFSARLSIGSILRLRAAALTALSRDSRADTALIIRLAYQFLRQDTYKRGMLELKDPSELNSSSAGMEDLNHNIHVGCNELDQTYSICDESSARNTVHDINNDGKFFFHNTATFMNQLDDPVSQFLETVPRSENGSTRDTPEIFLPGLVIHMVPRERHMILPFWKGWRVQNRLQSYRAYIANRASFTDIVVSPYMFLDHLPWRCHNAMEKALEALKVEARLDESQVV